MSHHVRGTCPPLILTALLTVAAPVMTAPVHAEPRCSHNTHSHWHGGHWHRHHWVHYDHWTDETGHNERFKLQEHGTYHTIAPCAETEAEIPDNDVIGMVPDDPFVVVQPCGETCDE